jgi:flagellar biogenesis protein FliO
MISSRIASAKLQSHRIPANWSHFLLPSNSLGRFYAFVASVFGRISRHRSKRLLQLSETLSLGEKRFLAIVTVENQRFLIAAAGQQISLLQRLPEASTDTSFNVTSNTTDSGEGHL